MASRHKRDISEYPRPWFYRPEVYYGFIIFPPVWSVLTLRSPWHIGEGFRGILVGGIAWFFIIASGVFAFRWVQPDDEGNRQILNLFLFVPGLLLTLVTQVQWAAHRAQYGPPPTESPDERASVATREPAAARPRAGSRGRAASGESRAANDETTPRRRPTAEPATGAESDAADDETTPRRRPTAQPATGAESDAADDEATPRRRPTAEPATGAESRAADDEAPGPVLPPRRRRRRRRRYSRPADSGALC